MWNHEAPHGAFFPVVAPEGCRVVDCAPLEYLLGSDTVTVLGSDVAHHAGLVGANHAPVDGPPG